MLTIITEDGPQIITEEKYPSVSPFRRATTGRLRDVLKFYRPILERGSYSDGIRLRDCDLEAIRSDVQGIEAELHRRGEP